MSTVLVERRGPVMLVTLNRPEVLNCIDPEVAGQLAAAIGDFGAEADLRVLVVTGAGGRAFCSGADLGTAEQLFRHATDLGEPPLAFSRLDAGKPTIAAIEGHCLAGGLELAVWCDMRIAGAGAVFGVVNRRWGIPLVDGGTQRLPRIVGQGNALYLIETGATIGADRAREMGLVQETVPEGQALDRALELAERIAAYPQPTLEGDRNSAIDAFGTDLETGLRREVDVGLQAAGDPAMAEGLERWKAGDRPPPPEGK